jgi:hypothetical protein
MVNFRSKHLIRNVYSPISANERQEVVINTIQLADRVSQQCEQLFEQRATYYQAHLLKAELDQASFCFDQHVYIIVFSCYALWPTQSKTQITHPRVSNVTDQNLGNFPNLQRRLPQHLHNSSGLSNHFSLVLPCRLFSSTGHIIVWRID